MRNTKNRSSWMRYGKWVPILTVLLGFCLFTIWILFSSIDEEETENSKVEVARRLVAAVFQPIEEFVRRKEHKERKNLTIFTKTNTSQILDLRKRKMQIDLNGVWNLNRSEGFDEYLRETGVGWAKRKMATTLGQTLTITHQELHFEIMITFIGIYTKTLTFNIGDEMEIDVGPTVNTSVRSSIQEGKLVLEGVCDGKPYKNSRYVENGELVQVMQLGDTQCKRIFIRKS